MIFSLRCTNYGGCDAFSTFLHSIVFPCILSTQWDLRHLSIFINILSTYDFLPSRKCKKSLLICPFQYWGFAFTYRVFLAQFEKSVFTFKPIHFIVLNQLFYTKDFNMYLAKLKAKTNCVTLFDLNVINMWSISLPSPIFFTNLLLICNGAYDV